MKPIPRLASAGGGTASTWILLLARCPSGSVVEDVQIFSTTSKSLLVLRDVRELVVDDEPVPRLGLDWSDGRRSVAVLRSSRSSSRVAGIAASRVSAEPGGTPVRARSRLRRTSSYSVFGYGAPQRSYARRRQRRVGRGSRSAARRASDYGRGGSSTSVPIRSIVKLPSGRRFGGCRESEVVSGAAEVVRLLRLRRPGRDPQPARPLPSRPRSVPGLSAVGRRRTRRLRLPTLVHQPLAGEAISRGTCGVTPAAA